MAYASGKIAKIFSKEIPPDNFDNTYKVSFKLEDDERWFNLQAGKRQGINLKDGAKGYREALVGSEIEFMHGERPYNGKIYNDLKASAIKVKSWGSASQEAPQKALAASQAQPATTPAAAPSVARTSAPVASGTDWAKKDAGAAASASIDKALAYLVAIDAFANSGTEEDYDLILLTARDMQGLVLKLQQEILDSANLKGPAPKEPERPASVPAAKKAVAKAAPPPPAPEGNWEEEEDEIPFNDEGA